MFGSTMLRFLVLFVAASLTLGSAACRVQGGDGDGDGDSDGDADGDGDGDSDGDADGDSDGDGDGDSDGDADGDSDGDGDGDGDCSTAPRVSGSLRNDVSDIDFTGETPVLDIEHKLDIDPSEDRCVAYVRLELNKAGLGCQFEIEFADTGDGAIGVTRASLEADSFCPGWSDAEEGSYSLRSQRGVSIRFVTHVPDATAEVSCISGATMSFTGELTLGSGSQRLVVDLSDLSLNGSFASTGNTERSCPCIPNCSSRQCGADPVCGTSCGTCDFPDTCDGSGRCQDGGDPCDSPVAATCHYWTECNDWDWSSVEECIGSLEEDLSYCGASWGDCLCACTSVPCGEDFYSCYESCWSSC